MDDIYDWVIDIMRTAETEQANVQTTHIEPFSLSAYYETQGICNIDQDIEPATE